MKNRNDAKLLNDLNRTGCYLRKNVLTDKKLRSSEIGIIRTNAYFANEKRNIFQIL